MKSARRKSRDELSLRCSSMMNNCLIVLNLLVSDWINNMNWLGLLVFNRASLADNLILIAWHIISSSLNDASVCYWIDTCLLQNAICIDSWSFNLSLWRHGVIMISCLQILCRCKTTALLAIEHVAASCLLASPLLDNVPLQFPTSDVTAFLNNCRATSNLVVASGSPCAQTSCILSLALCRWLWVTQGQVKHALLVHVFLLSQWAMCSVLTTVPAQSCDQVVAITSAIGGRTASGKRVVLHACSVACKLIHAWHLMNFDGLHVRWVAI